jgi:hypothetical protein
MNPKAPKASPPRARRHARKPSDKEQYKRFREFAREVGADESEEAFKNAFSKVVRPSSTKPPNQEK